MKKIKVIAIIGKSGSGKDSILSAFRNKNNDNYHILVPFTTRPQRENEKNGREYYFIDDKTVDEYLDKPGYKVAQCTSFNNWSYGFFYDEFKKDKLNIGIFTPTAIFQLYNSLWGEENLDIYTVCLTVKDKDRLLRQLNREKDPDVAEILRRFNEDKSDFLFSITTALPNIYYVQNNNDDDIKKVYQTIKDWAEYMGKVD